MFNSHYLILISTHMLFTISYTGGNGHKKKTANEKGFSALICEKQVEIQVLVMYVTRYFICCSNNIFAFIFSTFLETQNPYKNKLNYAKISRSKLRNYLHMK